MRISDWSSDVCSSDLMKGFFALRHGRLNINALMTVAVTGAFLIGQWAEAAMVMALYAIAELIEARAVDRARNAIKGLLDLAPETARSEARRVGKECVSKFRCGGSTETYKKKKK